MSFHLTGGITGVSVGFLLIFLSLAGGHIRTEPPKPQKTKKKVAQKRNGDHGKDRYPNVDQSDNDTSVSLYTEEERLRRYIRKVHILFNEEQLDADIDMVFWQLKFSKEEMGISSLKTKEQIFHIIKRNIILAMLTKKKNRKPSIVPELEKWYKPDPLHVQNFGKQLWQAKSTDKMQKFKLQVDERSDHDEKYLSSNCLEPEIQDPLWITSHCFSIN